VPLAIPDNRVIFSRLTVPSTDVGTIRDVNVKVDLTHTRNADLDIYLISPSGTRVELFTDVGGNAENFTNTVLDSDAAASITGGSAPFTGTFRPEGNLNLFDGQNLVGEWTLEVRDDQNQQTGTLLNWSITIEYQPSAPASNATNGATSAALTTFATGSRTGQQNAWRLDVNRDGWITPLDALVAINALNRQNFEDTSLPVSAPSSSGLDASGDGALTPIDALLVINWLNREASNFDPVLDGFDNADDDLESVLDLLAEDVAGADGATSPEA
jgi:subtilisin-like proprotein convertase family protein